MYLMYRPADPGQTSNRNIWVPIGKVAWEYSAKAERDAAGNWSITDFTPITTGTLPAGDDEHELHQWGSRLQDASNPPDKYTIPAW